MLFWNLYKGYLSLHDIELYLKDLTAEQLKDSDIKMLFCLYDYKKYGEATVSNEMI
ncbi:MAG: hypothetical protein RSA57_10160 [Cetobacterium sp.]|uniref:hypothetical protein n=1 Tax=Cetobacterium sp. TaxID=2071632 RepID=UPI002FC914D5